MKAICTLALLCVFLASCKKEGVKPSEPQAFLTIDIVNNSDATITHIYSSYKLPNTGYVLEDLGMDVLPKMIGPSKNVTLKMDNAFDSYVAIMLSGQYSTISVVGTIGRPNSGPHYGTNYNTNPEIGYEILNLINTPKKEHLTITVE